eukprot:scaffold1006_cov270-Pinguiococcus_pyrenoidosus.AAC.31
MKATEPAFASEFSLVSPWQKAQEERKAAKKQAESAASVPKLCSVVASAVRHRSALAADQDQHEHLRQLHREIDDLDKTFKELYEQMDGMLEDRERSLSMKLSTKEALELQLQALQAEEDEQDSKAAAQLKQLAGQCEAEAFKLQQEYETLRERFVGMTDINEDRQEMQNTILKLRNDWANDQFAHHSKVTEMQDLLRRKQLLWANKMPEVLERHKRLLQLKIPRSIQKRMEKATRAHEAKKETLRNQTAELRVSRTGEDKKPCCCSKLRMWLKLLGVRPPLGTDCGSSRAHEEAQDRAVGAGERARNEGHDGEGD